MTTKDYDLETYWANLETRDKETHEDILMGAIAWIMFSAITPNQREHLKNTRDLWLPELRNN